jgi:nucleoside-diphosphate-sugar epimerase
MDFTHVTDIVDGIVRAAESNEALNNVMNLASGQDVSINELADLLLKILGKKGEIEPTYAEPRPHETLVYEEVPSPIVSISKAERLVGYKPRVPFEVGLGEYIKDCRLKKTCQPSS